MKKRIISCLSIALLSINLYGGLEEAIEYDRSPSRLKISVNSVNRIVFPEEISFKVWSKEKGVDIITHKNELYVKYQPLERVVASGNEIEEKVLAYEGVPLDIFVATKNGKTYSLLLLPREIESRNVMLIDNTISQEIISKNLLEADSHSSVISSIIKDVIAGNTSYFYDISFTPFKTQDECFDIEQTKRLENGEHIVNIYKITALKTCDISEKEIIKLINTDAIGFGFDKDIDTLIVNDSINAILVKKAPNVIR